MRSGFWRCMIQGSCRGVEMSTQHRYALTEFQWAVIEPLLPNKPRGVYARGTIARCSTAPLGDCVQGRPGPTFLSAMDLRQSLCPLAQAGRLGLDFRGASKAYDGDLQMVDSSFIRASARRQPQKGGPDEAKAAARDVAASRCVGRSRRTNHRNPCPTAYRSV